MIVVRLPDSLSSRSGSETLCIDDPVETIADLIDALERRLPGFRGQLDDALFNFAVNDGMLLHGVRERTLRDGDVVELIPTISGGCS